MTLFEAFLESFVVSVIAFIGRCAGYCFLKIIGKGQAFDSISDKSINVLAGILVLVLILAVIIWIA